MKLPFHFHFFKAWGWFKFAGPLTFRRLLVVFNQTLCKNIVHMHYQLSNPQNKIMCPHKISLICI